MKFKDLSYLDNNNYFFTSSLDQRIINICKDIDDTNKLNKIDILPSLEINDINKKYNFKEFKLINNDLTYKNLSYSNINNNNVVQDNTLENYNDNINQIKHYDIDDLNNINTYFRFNDNSNNKLSILNNVANKSIKDLNSGIKNDVFKDNSINKDNEFKVNVNKNNIIEYSNIDYKDNKKHLIKKIVHHTNNKKMFEYKESKEILCNNNDNNNNNNNNNKLLISSINDQFTINKQITNRDKIDLSYITNNKYRYNQLNYYSKDKYKYNIDNNKVNNNSIECDNCKLKNRINKKHYYHYYDNNYNKYNAILNNNNNEDKFILDIKSLINNCNYNTAYNALINHIRKKQNNKSILNVDIIFLLAKTSLLVEDYDNAEKLFIECLCYENYDIETLYCLGLIYLKKQQYDKSNNLFLKYKSIVNIKNN